jgi:hypothetical protein
MQKIREELVLQLREALPGTEEAAFKLLQFGGKVALTVGGVCLRMYSAGSSTLPAEFGMSM